MLGLADRAPDHRPVRTRHGRARPPRRCKRFRTLYGFGADPAVVVLDLLDHAHGASVRQDARGRGPGHAQGPGPAAWPRVGAEASAGTLSRVWQMLLKAHDEVRRAPDPAAAAEMALIRLAYAADLPGPEEALKRLQAGDAPVAGGTGGGPRAPSRRRQRRQWRRRRAGDRPRPRAARQPAPARRQRGPGRAAVFGDVLALIETKRDVTLKLDVER